LRPDPNPGRARPGWRLTMWHGMPITRDPALPFPSVASPISLLGTKTDLDSCRLSNILTLTLA